MLTPEYLEHVSDKAIELYNNLEFRILEDIARRLVNAGTMTESARWQIKVAQESGLLYEYIVNLVASYMGQSEEVVKQIFEEASIESLKFDDAIYKKIGLNPIPIKQSESMLNILTSTLRNTNQQLYNLTMTTALSAQHQFINACNSAYIDVTSGAFDYNTAIFNAINQINGIEVIYPSGYKSKIDVAVRRAVLTGVSQATGELQLDRAKEMGCKYVETSAHIGARNVGTGPANHEEWQGRVFQLEGSDKYPNFYESTGYGTIEGLCGINCRHSFFPFYEGISKRAYTDKELNEINNKKVKYDNKEMSVYEATQIQRQVERNIRSDKREIIKLNGILTSEADEELLRNARDKFNIKSYELKRRENLLNDFCNKTGLVRHEEKERLKNFDKSISRRVVENNKTYVQELQYKQENDIMIKKIKSNGMRGTINLNPKIPDDIETYYFEDKHINTKRHHNITRQEAINFIKQAKVSTEVWDGRFTRYLSENGATYIDNMKKTIRTSFRKEEFDDKIKMCLEVLENG